jgi:hypothetical protein
MVGNGDIFSVQLFSKRARDDVIILIRKSEVQDGLGPVGKVGSSFRHVLKHGSPLRGTRV